MLSVTRTFLLSAFALAALAACQPKEEAKEASSTPAASAAPAASGESAPKVQAPRYRYAKRRYWWRFHIDRWRRQTFQPE